MTCQLQSEVVATSRPRDRWSRRVPAEAIEEMLELYRHRYLGWNVKHFHEHLLRDHHFSWGYTFIKTQIHAAGLVERAKRRGAHRRKRERKPCEGMMLHQDGSRVEWLAGCPPFDLIVTMDDATSTALRRSHRAHFRLIHRIY